MIGYLELHWPFNPNHRLRFFKVGIAGVHRWLFTVRCAVDDSLYIMPRFEGDYVAEMGAHQITLSPHSESKLSIHGSGVVNLTAPDGRRVRLRDALDAAPAPRQVVSFRINKFDNLAPATDDEAFKKRGGHTDVPIMGFPYRPLMLTVYLSSADEDFSVPPLGNSIMMIYHTTIHRSNARFSFVMWQDLSIVPGPKDIEIMLPES